MAKKPIRCSFCAKEDAAVDLLVSTPTGQKQKAYICELCVDVCASLHKQRQIDRITNLELAVAELIDKPAPGESGPVAGGGE